jgi:hypothetical protein
MKILAAIIFTIFCPVAWAQLDKLGLNVGWREGTITLLKDETELKGFIHHNDKLGLIKFKKPGDADTEILTVSPKGILMMKYYDGEKSADRKFASFNYRFDETGEEGYQLFEVLYEFRHFAVLSKTFTVKPFANSYSDQLGAVYYTKVGHEQRESICFVKENGELEVYFSRIELDIEKREWFPKKTKPYVNKKLLSKYTGKHWGDVKKFMRENKLKEKSKADILMTMNYYSTLEMKENK